MKKKRYTVEAGRLARPHAESGTTISEICRKLGVSEPTPCRWKKQFSGMGLWDFNAASSHPKAPQNILDVMSCKGLAEQRPIREMQTHGIDPLACRKHGQHLPLSEFGQQLLMAALVGDVGIDQRRRRVVLLKRHQRVWGMNKGAKDLGALSKKPRRNKNPNDRNSFQNKDARLCSFDLPALNVKAAPLRNLMCIH
ncbi:transposase [Sabulicella glaciei]|uniref:Transposase n=1 Tax=Sabulicella glaciei TaxID=2984948 RepID=A0ABT3NYV2_9PROT|nr:transposase [Roseococcus sp. MDT2-1-1]MCW8087351.1 transposase [Roseococcus sp. MDT2-1-1]